MNITKSNLPLLELRHFRSPELTWIPNTDTPFTLYYDETNNIRRLALTESGLNHQALDCFVLGGIALRPGARLPEIESLRRKARIQPSTKELKLKHFAEGDYAACLDSAKLEIFLTWVLDAPVHLHFSNFSVLNWAIVDLVDSILAVDRYRPLQEIHQDLKTELHALVRTDPLGYFQLLKTFDYPNIAPERHAEFLHAVRAFLFRNGFIFRNFHTMTLSDLLQEAAADVTLVFLTDNKSDVLVDRFDDVFLQRMATFRRAKHVFDEEDQVRRRLYERRVVIDGQTVDYCFANSKSEPAIQISDVLCGLLGKHFSSMEKHSIEELEAWTSSLSDRQRRNRALLSQLIDNAHEECPAFLFNQAPKESQAKSEWFLDGAEYPEDYRD
ncbi:DUF3800 domain-containing protein|uniref:DUF3800 domain-containing protein n=1 Tax=Stenotrophomonas sp. SbOxS2 TaxID=2723885 RepID=UPI0015D34105|nr:DUF3800 domain-containing protein [Stenotrophomonas sp. SbOxS2]NYT99361.1 DUF3800 domain-containing protein [Stenotrophomonas sp. SbOxS2]